MMIVLYTVIFILTSIQHCIGYEPLLQEITTPYPPNAFHDDLNSIVIDIDNNNIYATNTALGTIDIISYYDCPSNKDSYDCYVYTILSVNNRVAVLDIVSIESVQMLGFGLNSKGYPNLFGLKQPDDHDIHHRIHRHKEASNQYVIDDYRLIDVFYHLLSNIDDDCEIIQDVIECFGFFTRITERRHEAIKVGVLEYILDNVLEYNAIIQSVSVQTVYKFFSNFNNLDFAMINEKTMEKIPNILIGLLEKSMDYDDIEMQHQLLLSIESFSDGTNSEYRSLIILNSGCLRYVDVLLNESSKFISSPRKQSFLEIEGSCIWSDFEDKTVQCLKSIKYLHKLLEFERRTNTKKLCRDILWSLSNVLTYESIIICGFAGFLLSWIVINQFSSKQIELSTFYMEKIVKSTVMNQDVNNHKHKNSYS